MSAARLAQLARLTTLIAPLLGGVAQADVGGTLSLQSDARERGLSYSGDRPSAQVGLAWDDRAGWYAGAQLSRSRFEGQRRGARLQAYTGCAFELAPGLDGEVGAIAHAFENLSRYDFQEVYAGLMSERWTLRVYLASDYYGSGQRSLYGEFKLRWPVAAGVQLLGHVGVLRGQGGQTWLYNAPHGPTRVDLHAGASWQLGTNFELQLAWVAVSRGGPYTWVDQAHRRSAVLGLTVAF